MLDKLRSMVIFVRVAESASFKTAALRLNLSASVVSHHISQLEKELGVQLFYRSTRHVTLTESGIRFLDACQDMVDSAEKALSTVFDERDTGKLWVIAPTPLSEGPFIRDITIFCKQNPQIDLRLEFDDTPRNLVQEGIDVAITYQCQKDSSLVSWLLLSDRQRIYASPEYIEEFGPFTRIEELDKAKWILLGDNKCELLLKTADGKETSVVIRRYNRVNSIVVLRELTLSGAGIAQMPSAVALHHVQAGHLTELLPDCICETLHCNALFPARAMPHSLSRKFVEFIAQRIQAMVEHPEHYSCSHSGKKAYAPSDFAGTPQSEPRRKTQSM
jgi:DNA-binding transcriptional LysR family regulator